MVLEVFMYLVIICGRQCSGSVNLWPVGRPDPNPLLFERSHSAPNSVLDATIDKQKIMKNLDFSVLNYLFYLKPYVNVPMLRNIKNLEKKYLFCVGVLKATE